MYGIDASNGASLWNYENTEMYFGTGNHRRMTINSTGKVGIGTTDFTGNHKLRVEGSIGAREIKVEASGWSDFVFENGYELRTLEEVENTYKKKVISPKFLMKLKSLRTVLTWER